MKHNSTILKPILQEQIIDDGSTSKRYISYGKTERARTRVVITVSEQKFQVSYVELFVWGFAEWGRISSYKIMEILPERTVLLKELDEGKHNKNKKRIVKDLIKEAQEKAESLLSEW